MEASSSKFFTAGGYFSHHADREFHDKQKPAIVVVDNVNNTNNNFAVDDLLYFPKEEDDDDDYVITDAFFDSITGNSGDSSSLTVVDSCNSSISGGNANVNGSLSCRSFTDTQFSGGELCVPCDDLAELEWLSNFVDESFSSDDLQNLHLISPNTTNSKAPPPVTAADTSSSATTAIVNNSSSSISSIFPSDVSVPAKARSKRSRAAPCDWSSRLLLLSPAAARTSLETNVTAPPNSLNFQPKAKSLKMTASKRREREASTETPGRKCLHCASEKTPQWRTGPMGPKTLCNACGVRYKSGRLVPEYRPASSPTFVSAKHSNSHRKVMELRRQKEMHQQQQHLLSHQASIFGVSNGGDEFLFHHHQNVGPEYRLAYDLKCDGVPK